MRKELLERLDVIRETLHRNAIKDDNPKNWESFHIAREMSDALKQPKPARDTNAFVSMLLERTKGKGIAR